MTKVKAKIEKIQALANDLNAPEGEREAAKAMLSKLRSKYNIALDGGDRKLYWFKYHRKHHKVFLIQLVGKHLRCKDLKVFTMNRKRSLGFELTKDEWVYLSGVYAHNRNYLDKYVEGAILSAVLRFCRIY